MKISGNTCGGLDSLNMRLCLLRSVTRAGIERQSHARSPTRSSRSKACGEAGRGYCHHLRPSDISIIDYASRYPELLDLALSTSTVGVLNKLLEVFARFGLPVSVVYYGPQFASAEMTEFLTRPTIQHIKPSPLYRVLMVLLSDGTVELKILK